MPKKPVVKRFADLLSGEYLRKRREEEGIRAAERRAVLDALAHLAYEGNEEAGRLVAAMIKGELCIIEGLAGWPKGPNGTKVARLWLD